MAAVITPFGRPNLICASFHVPVVKVLEKFIRPFIGPSLPINFPEDNVIPLTCIEDLHTKLDNLERREIFNTVCVADCCGKKELTINSSTKKLDASGDVRVHELVLRYPEVYWIFLWEKKQFPECFSGSKEILELHFVFLPSISSLVDLLRRHLYGFRPCFDPSGMRSAVRLKLPKDSEKTSRHSAPFFSQSIANALLKRSDGINQQARTTEEGIHAALLALEAWVILEGKTLALSLEALNILHQMEAVAECAFLGASSRLPVKSRFVELEKQVDLLRQHTKDPVDVCKGFAAAIDEEEQFVLLNAYVLYTYGYNTFVVPSLAEMKSLFGRSVSKANFNIEVVMEDLDIRFGDADEIETKYLNAADGNFVQNIRGRTLSYPKLCKCKKRFFVSSQSLTKKDIRDVSAMLAKRGHRINVSSIVKPYGGFFDGEIQKLFDKSRDRSLLGRKAASRRIFRRLFDDNNWLRQKYSALTEIIDDIRNVYRSNDQFEEEDISLDKLRFYQWKLKYTSKCVIKKTILLIPQFLELYFIRIISSFIKILIVITLLICFFAYSYYLLDVNQYFNPEISKPVTYNGSVIQHNSFWFWLVHSAVTFFALQTGVSGDPLSLNLLRNSEYYCFWSLTIFEMLVGYIHLGILIAYLYQKISRR